MTAAGSSQIPFCFSFSTTNVEHVDYWGNWCGKKKVLLLHSLVFSTLSLPRSIVLMLSEEAELTPLYVHNSSPFPFMKSLLHLLKSTQGIFSLGNVPTFFILPTIYILTGLNRLGTISLIIGHNLIYIF